MKKQLVNFDFQNFSEGTITKDSLKTWRHHSVWLLPQVMAFLGSECKLHRLESGLFSPERFILDNLQLCRENKLLYNGTPVPESVFIGMIRILTHYPRGDILHTQWRQTKDEGLRYAAPVPLILSAFKEYRNIGYEDWDWKDPKMSPIVDAGFRELLPWIHDTEDLHWSRDELLQIREESNTKGVGPLQQLSIAVSQDMEFKKLPRLLKLLLCQVWCFNPQVYHKYMINNLENLDEPAEPLVASDVCTNLGSDIPKPLVVKNVRWGSNLKDDIPWDV